MIKSDSPNILKEIVEAKKLRLKEKKKALSLSDLEKSKFINDEFYSESKARSMIHKGNSINKIRNYLLGKGINNEFINQTINKIKDKNSDQDFFSAIKLCKKKRIGPARTEDNRSLFY